MAAPREPSEMRILSVAGEHLRRHGLRRFTVVAVAEEAGMTLIALVRGDEFEIFTGAERIVSGPERRLGNG